MTQLIELKEKYRLPGNREDAKDKTVKGGRGGVHGSSNSGVHGGRKPGKNKKPLPWQKPGHN